MTTKKRWTEFPLPPYSYVTGKFPHPLRDTEGHKCVGPPEPEIAPSNEDWHKCEAYLWGVDLYNSGFYWEAHEAWEGVWHAAGRSGLVADLQKSLIKLAAAGVKAREGRIAGVERHAARSTELAESVQSLLPKSDGEIATTNCFLGLNLSELTQLGKKIRSDATELAQQAAQHINIHVLPDLRLRTNVAQ